ncbi:hypothetical protein GCM10010371_67410 [Streptomyces subrutilus]|uniref:Uncharacterized protein n=1 Tax=Streptomyces subrutilus TaxID=36818 RepID=A0A5P2UVC8_9ACTN|nr:hypothetical protein CP968_32045 [Streptomyces subrutilus]GGZ98184.1 hypothetical protein GCM10010371_67410 [Streptomyces subrutilus]
MSEPDHAGLPEPSASPLPARPAGAAWQAAKSGLPFPEPRPGSIAPTTLPASRARNTLAGMYRRTDAGGRTTDG